MCANTRSPESSVLVLVPEILRPQVVHPTFYWSAFVYSFIGSCMQCIMWNYVNSILSSKPNLPANEFLQNHRIGYEQGEQREDTEEAR